jgi:ketosteroid isomerase-like protein
MPSSIPELVAAAFGAYEEGDLETLRRMVDPEIEVYSEPGVLNSGRYVGFDGWQQWIAQWEEAWEEMTYEPLEMIEIGDSLLVAPTRVVGKGAGSGVEIDAVFAYLYEVRDGRITRFHTYLDKEGALEAAGKLKQESERPGR